MNAQPTQRRRPTIAKEWQLAVLRKLQSESGNPTEEQRSAAAVETGLEEKWVRNWFIRQRSKNAARNRKNQLATTKVPTFKLYQPGMPSRRSSSTPIDPVSRLSSPASQESHSSPLTAIRRSRRSISAPIPSQNSTLVTHTTTIPTYSRDPLCNRYPDFSQFFRPQVHERSQTFELSASPLAIREMAPHVPLHLQGVLNLLNPFHLPLNFSTNLQSCPVAFSMRLVDLLGHSSLAQYPVFPLL